MENEKRPFLLVSHDFMRRKDLKPSEKVFLLQLAEYSKGEDRCSIPFEELERRCEMSIRKSLRNSRKIIDHLVSMGLLEFIPQEESESATFILHLGEDMPEYGEEDEEQRKIRESLEILKANNYVCQTPEGDLC